MYNGKPSIKQTKPAWRRISIVWACIGLLAVPAATISHAAASADNPHVIEPSVKMLVHEIKSGGTNTTPSQYVTIYNPGDSPVDLTGWKLEYAKQTFAASYCQATDWDSLGATLVNAVTLSESVASRSLSPPIELQINDNDPGAIHLVSPSGIVHDLVGWGKADVLAPCHDASQAPQLSAGKVLRRYLDCQATNPLDSDDNAADFYLADTPLPAELGGQTPTDCQPEEPPTSTPPVPTPDNTADCSSIIITELLPNPAGDDGGHEYIELHNPTNNGLLLKDCSLKTSANDAAYALNNLQLEPGSYLALTGTQTGLTLTNASGGTVWLLTATDEVQAVTYPADMDDDAAWTLASGTWLASYSPTPNAPNIAMPNKPCGDGLVRNPQTSRCTKPDTAGNTAASTSGTGTQLTSCKQGQERNPQTNRCRTVSSGTSPKPAACKPDQERNPETNRCRSLQAASSSAKDCPTGQERNPETKRCRKIPAVTANSSTKIEDQPSAPVSGSTVRTWIIIGTAVAVAIGYGLYEWRQEISDSVSKLFGRGRKQKLLHTA